MRVGNEVLPSYMSFVFSFSGMRIQGASLVPVTWDAEVELIGDNENYSPEEHTMAFQRMSYWTELALSDIIILDPENYNSAITASCENLTMWLPDAASDDIMSQALHCKLQTIAGSSVILGKITITPSDSPVRYFFSPAGSYNLEQKTSNFVDIEVYHQTPWYLRRDSLTYELLVDDNQTKSDYDEMLADYQDPLDLIDKQLADQNYLDSDPDSEAEIFQVDQSDN